jgi:hypothetical protein
MTLNKQSLCELRSMQQLPQKLRIVVEALCVLTGLQVHFLVDRLICRACLALTPLQPDCVPDPERAGAKIGDYWSPLKKRSPARNMSRAPP